MALFPVNEWWLFQKILHRVSNLDLVHPKIMAYFVKEHFSDSVTDFLLTPARLFDVLLEQSDRVGNSRICAIPGSSFGQWDTLVETE